jgi:hypothetical protein
VTNHAVNIAQYLYELKLDLVKESVLQGFAFQLSNSLATQPQNQAASNSCSACLNGFLVFAARLAHK